MLSSVTVIVCTHNPRPDYLCRTLAALQQQTLPFKDWELLVIDNASDTPLSNWVDVSWHPHAEVIAEPTLGLTAARLRGLAEARGEILVFVDDDNVLAPDYLQQSWTILEQHASIGALGGKSLPEFEVTPEPWFEQANVSLGLRDLGEGVQICHWGKGASSVDAPPRAYPAYAPIGAGLVIRKVAMQLYSDRLSQDFRHRALGRSGKQLTSGEDNDIVLTLLEQGWGVGYFPQLQLHHLMGRDRLSKEYLARLNRASCRSWVTVLDLHNVCPWPPISLWSLPLRQFKAFCWHHPWTDPVAYIRWQGACGLLEGQAQRNTAVITSTVPRNPAFSETPGC